MGQRGAGQRGFSGSWKWRKGGGLMIVSHRGETWIVGKVSSAPDCHFALKIINYEFSYRFVYSAYY